MRERCLRTILLLLLLSGNVVPAALAPVRGPQTFETADAFLDHLQRQSFNYFLEETNPDNGLVRDRSTPNSPCSIAAAGFALSVYNVGVERGWISRAEAGERVLRMLETFHRLPQGPEPEGRGGYRGWYYHFLDMKTGARAWNCELSTIDTALLLMGVIDASLFFDAPDPRETRIQEVARALVDRVDWQFMYRRNDRLLGMEWRPERGHSAGGWHGYSEAACMYLLGLGATNPLPPGSWKAWTDSFVWTNYAGQTFALCPPLFTHQYSHVWIDFRGRPDACTSTWGTDYFENARRATLAQRDYGARNPKGFPNYSASEWGWTACDGPGKEVGGVLYAGYSARGVPGGLDDGTIAPTAAVSSMPFLPKECLAATRHFYDTYRDKLWTKYGFRDAYNIQADWWGPDVLGIDQGPIILMIENARSGSVWNRMSRSRQLQRGLERAGFSPPPPRAVRANALAGSGMTYVTWEPVASYQTGFEVQFSKDGNHWETVKRTGRSEKSAHWKAAKRPEGWVRVRSLGKAVHSGSSGPVRINLAMESGPRINAPSTEKRRRAPLSE